MRRSLQKKIKYVLIISIFLFFISNLLFGWPIIKLYHDFLSAKFLASLENIVLPNNSLVINSFKRFGILQGNGNHCDCEIAVILESDMKINEVENYVKSSISLNSPFSSLGNNYSEIYYVNDQQLFKIHNGQTIEIMHDNKYPFYKVNEPSKFHIESDQYLTIRDLIKNTLQKNNVNYFIITAFDQTYSRLSLKDTRCR